MWRHPRLPSSALAWGGAGGSTAAWVTAREDAVGSRGEGLGMWRSLGLSLVAAPGWRLAGESRRCRLGQARYQHSLAFRYAAVPPSS